MAKVGRDGEIIRPKKPLPADPAKGVRTKEVSVKDIEKMTPVAPEEEMTIPILYGFTIKCATISLPGVDMGFVCENCPFTGTTQCRDAILVITDEQEEEIAKILIGKKEEPCEKH